MNCFYKYYIEAKVNYMYIILYVKVIRQMFRKIAKY